MLMTVTFLSIGIILWRRRKEVDDHSRTIQAVLTWVSAFFAGMFIMRTWLGTTTADRAFLEPEHTFVPILGQMTFFLYPMEVMRLRVSRTKIYTFLYGPLLILVLIGMCSGIEYTPIFTYADLWEHLGEFNVQFRILTLIVMLFYCFALVLVPYDWHHSSVDRKFILTYSSGFCLIGIFHFLIQMTHAYWLVIAHQIAWMLFFLFVAYYELYERLLPPPSSTERDTNDEEVVPVNDNLWGHILLLLESNGQWRSPELSLTSLSERLESNRTYVGEAFKRNTGCTFVDYITNRRINYVVETLKRNPEVNIYELFNYVGYRQRSTAWRNFKKITGFTPTEFIERLK
jgi:AraC-like DNA-binding protein